MNDLAEKALHGLAVAYRQVRGRPVLSFAASGCAVSAVIVVSGGIVGAAGSTRPLTSWLGLQNPSSPPERNVVASWVLLGAVVVLVLLWLALVEFVRRRPRRLRELWWLAAAWAVPFAVGPPLMDTSVYSYAAYGLLQRSGHNPYHVAPALLGDDPVAIAVDPASRTTVSGLGPLSTLLEHLAVSVGRGSALAAVIALRVVAVAAAVWIAWLATELGRDHPDRALVLTGANPLVLLYVVSAAHVDGLLVAFVLAALVAVQRRRWSSAAVLAALAGSVSAPGFVALVVVLIAHQTRRAENGRADPAQPRGRALLRDIVPAAAVICALGFAVPHGFGWLRTVGQQFADHTSFSVAGGISALLAPVVRGASYDDLAVGGRVTVLTALVCVLLYLLGTVGQRPIVQTVGFALLAVALLAPVLHPWYLLWGTLCVLPGAVGPCRTWLLAAVAGACVLDPSGFSPLVTDVVTGALLVVVAAGTTRVLIVQIRDLEPAASTSAPAASMPAASMPAASLDKTDKTRV